MEIAGTIETDTSKVAGTTTSGLSQGSLSEIAVEPAAKQPGALRTSAFTETLSMDDVQMNDVQMQVVPESYPVDTTNAPSGSGDGEYIEANKETPEKESEEPPTKKRKFHFRAEVIRAVTRHVPALRIQRKYRSKDGKPMSVPQVMEQMKTCVLSPHEKEEFRSKDFLEDERVDFEKVRLMFIDDNEARKYFKDEYEQVARKDWVEDVETNRFRLAKQEEDDEPHDEIGEDGVPCERVTGEPRETVREISTSPETEFEYYDIEGLKHLRIHKGIYKPVEMKEGTKQAIKDAIRTPPRYLYRASSSFGHKRTNGYDSITLHCPAAHINEDENCHSSMYEIPNGLSEFSEMLGRRFLWHDRRKDEMLSWTSSLLFALVHATGRLAKGQEGIVIHVIDTTKVTSMDGQPVDFHFAPDLLRLLDIKGWYGWESFERNNLQQPWYTHEWVTHNVVVSPKKHSWEANIEDMIDKGLYTFLPHLHTREGDDMRSLYHRCGYTRSKYHRKDGEVTPVTWDQFTLAKRLSRCFVGQGTQRKDPYCIPPLQLVIDFLGIEARPKRDEGFMGWISSNYTASDLLTIHYDRCTRVANNLPEQAQALDLFRDAAFALGLPETPGTRVWMADENFDWYGKWLKNASREIKIRQKGSEREGSLLKEMRKMAEVAEEGLRKRDEEMKRKKAMGREEVVGTGEKAAEVVDAGSGEDEGAENGLADEGAAVTQRLVAT